MGKNANNFSSTGLLLAIDVFRSNADEFQQLTRKALADRLAKAIGEPVTVSNVNRIWTMLEWPKAYHRAATQERETDTERFDDEILGLVLKTDDLECRLMELESLFAEELKEAFKKEVATGS